MRPEVTVRDRVIRARTQMLLDEPFFGMLALRLAIREDTRCQDMWTDATSLGYNPRYVESLADVELRGLIAHLVLHIAAGHPWRQGARDHKVWQEATDRAIYHIHKASGYRMPQGAIVDTEFKGQPAELVYAELKKRALSDSPPPDAQANEDGDDDSSAPGDAPGAGEADEPANASEGQPQEGEGGTAASPQTAPGEVRPAPEGTDEIDWKMAMEAASRMQGDLPSDLERLVAVGLKARVDWKDALRQYIQQSVYSPDYTWMRPNRRYLHLGLYVASLHGENIRCIVIARDTSGSIHDTYMGVFNTEVLDILVTHSPEEAYVVDCDAAIAQVISIAPLEVPDDLPAKGGGGTSFIPVFKWIEEQGLTPDCLVYLTDLEGSFPAQDPGYPVVWAVPEGHYKAKTPPFGEVLSITLN